MAGVQLLNHFGQGWVGPLGDGGVILVVKFHFEQELNSFYLVEGIGPV